MGSLQDIKLNIFSSKNLLRFHVVELSNIITISFRISNIFWVILFRALNIHKHCALAWDTVHILMRFHSGLC